MYVRSHSKSILMKAIRRDTKFLCSQSIMDYSLIVGVDEREKKLVIGIIGKNISSFINQLH